MTLQDKYREICQNTLDQLNSMIERDDFSELEDYLQTGIALIHLWERERR